MSTSASQNPVSVEAIVSHTLLSLRQSSEGMDDLLAGAWAEMAMRHVFNKGVDELLETIHATPQGKLFLG